MIRVPVNEPTLLGNEKKYLAECIDTGWISSEGPFVARLEEGIARQVCRRHGIAVCNGSAALDVAIAALEIGPGDEVILPTFTIISCAAAIVRAGAVPVVVDSDPQTWNMSIPEVEAAITERTKAVLAVHLYGLPVDMKPLLELTQRHGLKLVEDAAEALGQTSHGAPCGGFGDISTFSFYPNKHVTTGEGGMVLTNDEALASKCRSLRNLCFGQKKRFVHESLGWNFRMSNLQAAVGVAQLERLENTLQRKRHIGALYTELLKTCPRVQLPLQHTAYAENIYWVFGVVLSDELEFDAEEAATKLARLGIQTRPFFWPMHEQPALRKLGLFEGASLPHSERLARRGFYLPSGVALTDDQIHASAWALRNILS